MSAPISKLAPSPNLARYASRMKSLSWEKLKLSVPFQLKTRSFSKRSRLLEMDHELGRFLCETAFCSINKINKRESMSWLRCICPMLYLLKSVRTIQTRSNMPLTLGILQWYMHVVSFQMLRLPAVCEHTGDGGKQRMCKERGCFCPRKGGFRVCLQLCFVRRPLFLLYHENVSDLCDLQQNICFCGRKLSLLDFPVLVSLLSYLGSGSRIGYSKQRDLKTSPIYYIPETAGKEDSCR